MTAQTSQFRRPATAMERLFTRRMIADPARRTMRIYTENPCANDLVEYDLSLR